MSLCEQIREKWLTCLGAEQLDITKSIEDRSKQIIIESFCENYRLGIPLLETQRELKSSLGVTFNTHQKQKWRKYRRSLIAYRLPLAAPRFNIQDGSLEARPSFAQSLQSDDVGSADPARHPEQETRGWGATAPTARASTANAQFLWGLDWVEESGETQESRVVDPVQDPNQSQRADVDQAGWDWLTQLIQ